MFGTQSSLYWIISHFFNAFKSRLHIEGSFIYMGKIYIRLPNYHHFFGWHPELSTLAFQPPKLLLSDFFLSHPSIYTIKSNRNWPKTRKIPPLTVRSSKCRRGIFRIMFKIKAINGRIRLKNQKVVVWGARI